MIWPGLQEVPQLIYIVIGGGTILNKKTVELTQKKQIFHLPTDTQLGDGVMPCKDYQIPIPMMIY